jgi:hypothetical protein
LSDSTELVTPTTMPDGTILNGVLYNSGKHDLLLYSDGILFFPGSSADAVASIAPAAWNINSGSPIASFEALGPSSRPEALRLFRYVSSMSREQILADPSLKLKSDSKRPKAWFLRNKVIDRVGFTESTVFRPALLHLYCHLMENPYLCIESVTNANPYAEALLEYCFGDKFRQVSRGEAKTLRSTGGSF